MAKEPTLTSAINPSTWIAERNTVMILAITCGLAVGNVYINQPLLADMGRSFNISIEQIGFIPTSTQIGYAIGLLLLAPLGDRLERRRLIVTMLSLIACALAAVALSPNVIWLCGANWLLGFTTMVSHLIIPLVAQLTPPSERGKVIGTLMSGVIISLLLSRAVSGFVGGVLGWQSMYWIAAGLILIAALLIRERLPLCPPVSHLPYRKLMRSLLDFTRQQPTLRESAVNNALVFGSFNAFWATLVFLLETPPHHYGSQVAGLFGLLGVAGALGAPMIGRLIDQQGARHVISISLVLALSAFVLLWLAATHLVGLGLGVVILDLGMHGAYLANQIRVYSLVPNAESRLNTVYMVINYSGGAIGSYLGLYNWAVWQWNGVCFLGCSLLTVATIVHFSRHRTSSTA
jgi:predicted MFS family arabinose efflux permease